MSTRSWRIIPETAPGIWAVGLIIAMPILFAVGSSLPDSIYESVPAGRTIPEDINTRPYLALTMLAGMAAGISAFILGLVSTLKHKEHALLVYLATGIGGLLILFLAAEVAFPH